MVTVSFSAASLVRAGKSALSVSAFVTAVDAMRSWDSTACCKAAEDCRARIFRASMLQALQL